MLSPSFFKNLSKDEVQRIQTRTAAMTPEQVFLFFMEGKPSAPPTPQQPKAAVEAVKKNVNVPKAHPTAPKHSKRTKREIEAMESILLSAESSLDSTDSIFAQIVRKP